MMWNSTVHTIDNDLHWPLPQPLSFDRFPIPTYYSQSLQTQDFWDNVVATKGRSALRPPRPFKAPVLELKQLTRVYSVVPNENNPQKFEAYPDVYEKYQDCVDHLQTRKKLWKRLRGISEGQHDYLAEAYAQWQRTPYSLVEMRNCVEVFTDGADAMDEATCTYMIKDLSNKIERWEEYAGADKKALGFVYSMLLKLMKAAMPWRRATRENILSKKIPEKRMNNRWQPSPSAIVKGTPWRFYDAWMMDEVDAKSWKSVGYHSREYRLMTVYDARVAMINAALRDGQRCWTMFPTPVGLLDAVRQQAQEMLEALDLAADQHGPHITRDWLPFTFTFPDWDMDFERGMPSDKVGHVVAVGKGEARTRNKGAQKVFMGSPPPSPGLGTGGKWIDPREYDEDKDEDEDVDMDEDSDDEEEEEDDDSDDDMDVDSDADEDSDSDVEMGDAGQSQSPKQKQNQNQQLSQSQDPGARLKMFLDIGKLSGVTQAKKQTVKGSARGISKPGPRRRLPDKRGGPPGGGGGGHAAGSGFGITPRFRGGRGGQPWRSSVNMLDDDDEEEEEEQEPHGNVDDEPDWLEEEEEYGNPNAMDVEADHDPNSMEVSSESEDLSPSSSEGSIIPDNELSPVSSQPASQPGSRNRQASRQPRPRRDSLALLSDLNKLQITKRPKSIFKIFFGPNSGSLFSPKEQDDLVKAHRHFHNLSRTTWGDVDLKQLKKQISGRPPVEEISERKPKKWTFDPEVALGKVKGEWKKRKHWSIGEIADHWTPPREGERVYGRSRWAVVDCGGEGWVVEVGVSAPGRKCFFLMFFSILSLVLSMIRSLQATAAATRSGSH